MWDCFHSEDDDDDRGHVIPLAYYVSHFKESPLTLASTPEGIMGLLDSLSDEADISSDGR